MKTLFIVLFTLFTVQTLTAQTAPFPAEKKSAIVANLKAGIESENAGLHTSAALVLSDLISESYLQSGDASNTLIPLLRLLENGKTDEERIAAAFALYQLGNNIGIYRLRGTAIFDDNEKVARVCKNLYYTYHILNGSDYFLNF
jgi:HEAT repeat protein